MEHSEAVNLIRDGIESPTIQHWADLGCGSGTFTTALASLLPAKSKIIAVDKDWQRITPNINNVDIEFIQQDFINDKIAFNNIDGVLMANSLHYVRDISALLKKLEACFRDEHAFVIVEYESRRANPWVPYPIRYIQLADLATQLGYSIKKLNEMPSRFGGAMYSALLSQ